MLTGGLSVQVHITTTVTLVAVLIYLFFTRYFDKAVLQIVCIKDELDFCVGFAVVIVFCHFLDLGVCHFLDL